MVILVVSAGIEPTSTDSESVILSVELRNQNIISAAKLRASKASIQIMKHKIYLFLCIIFFQVVSVQAQGDFGGNWEGVITMEREGKIVTSFKFVLNLIQDSSRVEGRSCVWSQDAKAIFSVSGTIKDNQLIIKDLKAIEADSIPSGEWCLKIMQLKFIPHRKYDKLEGTWQGKTSFSQCTPGKVALKRITSRV
jgi:hypothetical protein